MRHDNAEDVARAYVELLASIKVEGIVELLDDEVLHEFPFSMDPPIRGKGDLAAHYRRFPNSFSSAQMAVTATWPHLDVEWVSVEYEGSITAHSGEVFENSYLSMFWIVGGKIRTIREFFVPVVPQSFFEA